MAHNHIVTLPTRSAHHTSQPHFFLQFPSQVATLGSLYRYADSFFPETTPKDGEAGIFPLLSLLNGLSHCESCRKSDYQ